MRIMLTGSTGFLGRYFLKYLRKNTDWDIIMPSTDDLILNGLPELGVFDYIINLGSASSVEQSVKDPTGFILNNSVSMLEVLEYARNHPPHVFLHMSTVEVYNVTNPYAASKSAQESIAEAYWKTYDVPVVIARSSNIIGAGQSKDKFVPKIIEQIKNGETVKLYTNQGEQGRRRYIPIENVASALLFLLQGFPAYEKNATNKQTAPPVHFDIGGGEELSNLEMAQLIAQKLDKPLKHTNIEPQKTRPTYAQNLVATGTLLDRPLWIPPKTLEESLSWIR